MGKAFGVEPANLSSIPETYIVGGANQLPQVIFWLLHIYTPNHNKLMYERIRCI